MVDLCRVGFTLAMCVQMDWDAIHKQSRKTQNVGVLPLEEWSVQTLGQRFTVGFGSLNFLSRPCWCAMYNATVGAQIA